MDFVFPVSNFLQKITLRLFADWKVTGKEFVPPIGPLLIVANHQSNMDPPIIGASTGRRTWFLAKHTVFKGSIANWFLESYGAFPLNRDGTDVRAYRWALNKLENGEALVVFPEGTRSANGLRKGMPGVVQLALKSQAPILPVGITGTEKMGTWMRVLNPTGKLTVNIGRVFTLPTVEGKPGKDIMKSLTDMVMLRVARLLPESYQGVYRNLS